MISLNSNKHFNKLGEISTGCGSAFHSVTVGVLKATRSGLRQKSNSKTFSWLPVAPKTRYPHCCAVALPLYSPHLILSVRAPAGRHHVMIISLHAQVRKRTADVTKTSFKAIDFCKPSFPLDYPPLPP